MNLLIAEDEIRILNSLAYNIPWDRHGIEVVGLAGNGREALAIAERRMPDIVLLDIEMPEMDGLALAETLLKRAPQTGIIILSGHDDFSYAQRAIGLGVTKYLLKPAGEEEILQSVVELAAEIRRELSEKHSLGELKRMWSSRLPQLQEDFLRGLMTTRYAPWELRKHCMELNLELPEDRRYAVAVCDMDPLAEGERRFAPADLPLLRFSLHSIAREFVPAGECRVFSDAGGVAVLVFPGRPGETEGDLTTRINTRMSRLLGTVRECLKLTASAGMGTTCLLADISQSYRQACIALRERAVYGHEIAIPYLEVRRSERTILPDSSFEKQLEIAICTGEGLLALEQVDVYAEEAFAAADFSGLIYEHLLYLSGAFTRIILSQGWPMKKVLGPDYAYFLSLEGLVSKEQITEWAKRVTARIVSYAEEERSSSSNHLVKSLRELVDSRLADDLSLYSLAESLYVNSSYLSRLFKRETGESFSGYVLARRMERAKELLLGDAKVYDAAQATGYRDISYFAKVFRKYWGVAPSGLKK
ncbi:response regulator [Paenibacillus sp. S150]|uniref:response regulator n=1 Tax=Paenibacillus sp. S150 TaxID=2749826 RepID=UPI001C59D9B5|nr:response regulator [Paenibacillus sp. S150]MBW4085595.1 response regulator [Paenibacillus sp. S150]